MKKCDTCDLSYDDNINFCNRCGNTLSVANNEVVTKQLKNGDNKCLKCNLSYDSDKKFCKKCGAPLTIFVKPLTKVDAKKLVFEERLKENQLNVELLNEYAQFLFENAEFKESTVISFRVLAIEEHNLKAQNLLFKAYLEFKQYQDALEIGEELLADNPNDIELLEKLAMISSNLKNFEKELEYYDRILSLNPDHLIALTNKAEILLNSNKIKQAVEIYSKLDELGAKDALTCIYSGINKALSGQYQEAISKFDEGFKTTTLPQSDISLQRGLLYWSYCLCMANSAVIGVERKFNTIIFNTLKKFPYEFDGEIASKILSYIVIQNLEAVDSLQNIALKIDELILSPNERNAFFTEKSNEIIADCYYNIGLKQKESGFNEDAVNSFENAQLLMPEVTKYSVSKDEIQNLINTKNTKRKRKKALIIGVAFTAIIVLIFSIYKYNSNKDNNAWELAKSKNTSISYLEYSKLYPNGKYKMVADSLVDVLSWTTATSVNTVESYRNYLDSLPSGKYRFQADSIMTAYINDEARLAEIKANKCVDIDGYEYKTVRIGSQVWMAENLRVTHYRNGEEIPNVTDNDEWSNLTTGAYCNYKNNANYGQKHGRLYNWYAVDDYRGLAPAGWHVPTDEEWRTLIQYLGGENVAGGKLKSKLLWKQPNVGATNESGFNGLPCGYRYSGNGGVVGEFGSTADGICTWRTATMSEENGASFEWSIMNNEIKVQHEEYYLTPSDGSSVRCIKN